jgi:hypothetical protein
MKEVERLKEQLILEIKDGRTSPSQAAEKFAAATGTAFHATECYLSYGDGNFRDLAAEWINSNLDSDSASEIEDLFAYCQPNHSLLLRQHTKQGPGIADVVSHQLPMPDIACAGFTYVFSIDAAADDADDYNGTVEVFSQSVGGYAPPAHVAFHWVVSKLKCNEVENCYR